MYCKQCGKQIDDDARFCPSCGASVDASREAGAPDITVFRQPSSAPEGHEVARGGRGRLAAHIVACVLAVAAVIMPLLGMASIFGVTVRGLDLATLFMQSKLFVSLLESVKLSSDGLVVPATVISCGYCLLWLVGVVACISFIASTCISADGSTSAVISSVVNVALALYPLLLCAAIDFIFGDTMTRLGLNALSGAMLAAPAAACFVQLVVAAAQFVLVLAPDCYRPASSNWLSGSV